MLGSRLVRYFVYGSCAIITSEIIYYSYTWLKKKRDEDSTPEEIFEVVWTNELTQSCIGHHRRVNNGGGDSNTPTSSSPTMSQLGRIVKLPTISRNPSKSDCPNPYCAAYNVGRLIQFIDAAKYSIDLAMYTFTSYELSQAFGRALKRGVLIRIISDHEMAYSSGSQIIPLTRTGVPVRCNTSTTIMHHKFCVLDCPQRISAIFKRQSNTPDKGPARGLLMTGSLNWTMQGFGGNWENILITSNAEYLRKYSQEFDRIWNAFDLELKPIPKKSLLK